MKHSEPSKAPNIISLNGGRHAYVCSAGKRIHFDTATDEFYDAVVDQFEDDIADLAESMPDSEWPHIKNYMDGIRDAAAYFAEANR